MIYELMNPSEPLHFEADDLKTAAIVAIMLGGGHYGAYPVNWPETEAPHVPIMQFMSKEAWWRSQFGEGLHGATERNREKIIKALRTMCYGSPDDLRVFKEQMAKVKPSARNDLVSLWADRRRHTKDIMTKAHETANDLERENGKRRADAK
jgi:hypothetical protein